MTSISGVSNHSFSMSMPESSSAGRSGRPKFTIFGKIKACLNNDKLPKTLIATGIALGSAGLALGAASVFTGGLSAAPGVVLMAVGAGFGLAGGLVSLLQGYHSKHASSGQTPAPGRGSIVLRETAL